MNLRINPVLSIAALCLILTALFCTRPVHATQTSPSIWIPAPQLGTFHLEPFNTMEDTLNGDLYVQGFQNDGQSIIFRYDGFGTLQGGYRVPVKGNIKFMVVPERDWIVFDSTSGEVAIFQLSTGAHLHSFQLEAVTSGLLQPAYNPTLNALYFLRENRLITVDGYSLNLVRSQIFDLPATNCTGEENRTNFSKHPIVDDQTQLLYLQYISHECLPDQSVILIVHDLTTETDRQRLEMGASSVWDVRQGVAMIKNMGRSHVERYQRLEGGQLTHEFGANNLRSTTGFEYDPQRNYTYEWVGQEQLRVRDARQLDRSWDVPLQFGSFTVAHALIYLSHSDSVGIVSTVGVHLRPVSEVLGASNYADQTECVIPPSGPWPLCAINGGYENQPLPATSTPSECVIPPSGPWPPCAR